MKRILRYVTILALVPALLAACGPTAELSPQAPTAPPATATLAASPTSPPPTEPPPTLAPPAEASPAPRPEGTFVRYHSETLGFAIEQPEGWDFVERERFNTVLFVAPGTGVEGEFRANLSVGVQDVAPPLDSLQAYTDAFLDQAPGQINEFELLSSEPALLDGRPAYRVVYTGDQTGLPGDEEGLPLKWLQVWALDGGQVDIVTYTARPALFDKYLPQAEYMISTLEIALAPEASQ